MVLSEDLIPCLLNPNQASRQAGMCLSRHRSKAVHSHFPESALLCGAHGLTLARARGEAPGDPCGVDPSGVGCAAAAGRLASAAGPGVRAGEGPAAADSVRSPLARAC